jgi:translation initiation factor IF-1
VPHAALAQSSQHAAVVEHREAAAEVLGRVRVRVRVRVSDRVRVEVRGKG